MKNKEELIEAILEIEQEMFLAVNAKGDPSCQLDPDGFRLHRGAQFSAWSEQTLSSYLRDLETARTKGVNLMTIKYGRMEGVIPQRNTNPLIEDIARLQYRWQQEIFEKYPQLMAGARDLSSSDDTEYRTSFETYLQGELETYSDETLASLYADMVDKQQRGINMSEEVYQVIAIRYGHDSIDEAERSS